ncbi:MAG TPA: hypothetical protein VF040_04195, partial [Ktedonobacterales bacterium]
MARSMPAVHSGTLTLVTDGAEAVSIAVDSPAWQEWLARDDSTSFRFESGSLCFTARRRRRRETWHWYATQGSGKERREIALGMAADVTLERLQQAAEALTCVETATAAPIAATPRTARAAAPARDTPNAGAATAFPGARSQRRPPRRRMEAGAPHEAGAQSSGSPPAMPLLATKLFIPPIRPNLVPRPRLLSQLEVGLRGPLTVIVAPAGWGKTSLLSAWCAQAERIHNDGECIRQVAWVSLDAADNDPVRFWTYILTALDTTCAGVADEALAGLRSPQPPPVELILTLLLNGLAMLPSDVVLVLDDYHAIEAESIHASVAFLLDHQPPRFHLVVVTREDPPLPLARRRAHGAVTELRAADLRFTREETAHFLSAALGMPLATEVVEALEARSEGWVVGLQLAALSLQGRTSEQAEAFIAAFASSNRYIVDYLVEEVLARQSSEVQTFLLRTAVVERFCAPLCARLLMESGAGGSETMGSRDERPTSFGQHGHMALSRSAAQALLERLERANLFLIPLDDERRWYRYHHLFAEVLRSQLRQVDPGLSAVLLQRASVWCEEEGLLEEAVDYALAAADFERAASLIEHRLGGMAVLRAGRFETGLGWMRALPESLIRTRPLLSTMYAVLLMYAGQMDAVPAHLHDAEAALASNASAPVRSDDGTLPPFASSAVTDELRALQGYVAVAQATIPLFSGDLAQAQPLVQTGVDLVPTSETVWRAGALSLAAYSYQLSGEATPTAERQAQAALAAVQETGNVAVLAPSGITNLAHVYLMQGRLRQAAAVLEQVPRVPPPLRLEHLPGSHAYHAAMGELLREWNDLEAAEQHLTLSVQGLDARIVIPADVLAQGYLGLARLQCARGEFAAALATLGTFEQVARSREFVAELIERGAALRAQVHLAFGDLAAAVQWVEASRLVSDEATALPYRRESAYLTLARVRVAQARSEPNSLYLREVELLLERLQREAEVHGRGRSVLEILVLRALALYARRDTRGAVRTLLEGLERAQPEGYVRLFTDEDLPMASLLTELIEVAAQRRLAVPAAILDYARGLVAV